MSGTKRALLSRYNFTRLALAADEVFAQLFDKVKEPVTTAKISRDFSLSNAVALFQEAYNRQLTSVICITGAAMAPTLNAKAQQESTAFEKLVVRLLPRPSSRTVAVGDVVALRSPFVSPGSPDAQNVLVRRVAAVEGEVMVSDEPEDQQFVIPPGHCWVLADNPKMKPPDVIDSRVFGHFPMTNIVGRIIYRAASQQDHEMVTNSPRSAPDDMAICDEEVDVKQLFPEHSS